MSVKVSILNATGKLGPYVDCIEAHAEIEVERIYRGGC